MAYSSEDKACHFASLATDPMKLKVTMILNPFQYHSESSSFYVSVLEEVVGLRGKNCIPSLVECSLSIDSEGQPEREYI